MRTLKFVVDNQIITRDPACDFSNLIPGTEGYLRAEFSFSPEWDGYAKIAGFWSPLGIEYPPQILEDGNSCMIPSEALQKQTFKVQIVGKNTKGVVLRTNKVTVIQNGGNT